MDIGPFDPKVLQGISTAPPIRKKDLRVGDKVVINPKGNFPRQGLKGKLLLVGEIVLIESYGMWDVLVRWPYVEDDWWEDELYYKYNDTVRDIIPIISFVQGFTE